KVEEAIPALPDSYETFARHWFPGAANALRAFTADHRKPMDPGLVEIAEAGARLTLLDYLAAVREREAMGVAMNLFHRQWALLLTPTRPGPGSPGAFRDREVMGVALTLFLRQWDLRLTPTLPIPAFAAGREVPDGDAG